MCPLPLSQTVAPDRIGKWGTPQIFCRALHIFGSEDAISRFRERFRDGQYSVVSFLFAVLILTVPPCPAICKSRRGHVPRALWSRRQ